MTAPPCDTSLVTISVSASSARLALALSSEAFSAMAATSWVFVMGFCVMLLVPVLRIVAAGGMPRRPAWGALNPLAPRNSIADRA